MNRGFNQPSYSLYSPEEKKIPQLGLQSDKYNNIRSNNNNFNNNKNNNKNNNNVKNNYFPKFLSAIRPSSIVPSKVIKNNTKIIPCFTIGSRQKQFNSFNTSSQLSVDQQPQSNEETQIKKRKSLSLLDLEEKKVFDYDKDVKINKTPIKSITTAINVSRSSSSKGATQMKSILDSVNNKEVEVKCSDRDRTRNINNYGSRNNINNDSINNYDSSNSNINNSSDISVNSSDRIMMKRGTSPIIPLNPPKKRLEFVNKSKLLSDKIIVNNQSLKRKNSSSEVNLCESPVKNKNKINKKSNFTEVIDLIGDSSEEEDDISDIDESKDIDKVNILDSNSDDEEDDYDANLMKFSSIYIGKSAVEPNDIESTTNYSCKIAKQEKSFNNFLEFYYKNVYMTFIKFDDMDTICYNNFNKDGTEKFIAITLKEGSYSAGIHSNNLDPKMKKNSKSIAMKYVLLIGSDKNIINLIDNISSWNLYQHKICNAELSTDVYLYTHFNHCDERNHRNISNRTSRTRTKNLIEDKVNVDDTEVYFIFPIEVESQDAVTITKGDYNRLSPNIWLNDSIIDCKIKHFLSTISQEKKNKVHLFSALFFTKLLENRAPFKSSKEEIRKVKHNNVKNWTKNIDIFDFDYILFPINYKSHWSLAVLARAYLIENLFLNDSSTNKQICNNNLELKKNIEEEEDDDTEKPAILFMDSLGSHSPYIFSTHIRDWLYEEWCIKKLTPLINSQENNNFFSHIKRSDGLTKDDIFTLKCSVPVQQNCNDCGVFTCKFVEEIFEKLPSTTQRNLNDRMINIFNRNIFSQSFITQERREIKLIFDQISIEWKAYKKNLKENNKKEKLKIDLEKKLLLDQNLLHNNDENNNYDGNIRDNNNDVEINNNSNVQIDNNNDDDNNNNDGNIVDNNNDGNIVDNNNDVEINNNTDVEINNNNDNDNDSDNQTIKILLTNALRQVVDDNSNKDDN